MRVDRQRVSPIILFLSATMVFVVSCDNRNQTTGGLASSAIVGASFDDSIITTKIRSGLLADPLVKSLDPKIETHKGTVQLSGFVENRAQMNRVIEIARAVNGVGAVENKMTIKK